MNNRIRELRAEKKITQLQLSIKLGVTQETVSAYEHNRHLPSLATLMKMSELFDASMDYIMGLSSVRRPVQSPGNDSIELEQQSKLNYCYHRLSSRNKLRLLSYAEGLLDSGKE